MAASPGPRGYPNPGSQPPQPPGRRPATRRRVGWLVLAALACLFIVVAVTLNPKPTGARHRAPAPGPRPTIAQAARQATLTCHARAQRRRPRDRTTVRIRVRTAARARVMATTRRTPLREHASGRASATGTWNMRFHVGDARPGARIVIAVRVSRHGRAATCRASLRPRRIAVVAARPHPRGSVSAAPPPPSPSPTAASCYPLSDEGTCYEPGEYCRDSDHGASGVAGDGERIVCQDNDGWRWEPA